MAIQVTNKMNSRLRFLYRQNRFLNAPLSRLLCNAMNQPFFDLHVMLGTQTLKNQKCAYNLPKINA